MVHGLDVACAINYKHYKTPGKKSASQEDELITQINKTLCSTSKWVVGILSAGRKHRDSRHQHDRLSYYQIKPVLVDLNHNRNRRIYKLLSNITYVCLKIGPSSVICVLEFFFPTTHRKKSDEYLTFSIHKLLVFFGKKSLLKKHKDLHRKVTTKCNEVVKKNNWQ